MSTPLVQFRISAAVIRQPIVESRSIKRNPRLWWLSSVSSRRGSCGSGYSETIQLGVDVKVRLNWAISSFQTLSLHQSHNDGEVTKEGDCYAPELQGFARRVDACNHGKERKAEFLPFLVEKDILGYIHNSFAEHLRKFPEVFSFEGVNVDCGGGNGNSTGGCISLHRSLSSPQKRTAGVQAVLETLAGSGVISGWRDELLPVKLRYDAPPVLLMERAAISHFGAKAYGVHLNGYTYIGGEMFLWVAKRSVSKPNWPGMLDNIAAGGQPAGISAKANIIKECEEEASIPSFLAEKAVAAGAVSYEGVEGVAYRQDVLFCYDLELPKEFKPHNRDGEVEFFHRLPVSEVMEIVNKTESYKPNCNLVLIDFFIRHGYFNFTSLPH